MITIQETTIGEAWRKLFELVKNKGASITDDEEELLELMNIFIIVDNPDHHDVVALSDLVMRKWMKSNFCQKVFAFGGLGAPSYGWRLYGYNGFTSEGINQIGWVIDKLYKKPEAKSATITMLREAGCEPYIPCVSLLDFKIRDDTLILTVTCRSLDVGKKAVHNMAELARIIQHMAMDLGLDKTRLVMHIISAHIYVKDIEEVEKNVR